MRADVVELFVQRRDLDLGFQVDLIVVLSRRGGRAPARGSGDIRMTGAWIAASSDSIRLRKMKGYGSKASEAEDERIRRHPYHHRDAEADDEAP